MINCPLFDSKIDNKRIIKLYYTALMTFLVFTFANNLLQGIIEKTSLEYALYMIFWVSLVIQTTYAYKHIMAIKSKRYKALILVSDCIDVVIEVFVCAVISNTYRQNVIHELADYRFLSIPFMILAINQICWYIGIKEKNQRAITRLIILFVGMLTVTISESICHSIFNLAIFVIIHALSMAILRGFDETRYQHKKYTPKTEDKSKEDNKEEKTSPDKPQ